MDDHLEYSHVCIHNDSRRVEQSSTTLLLIPYIRPIVNMDQVVDAPAFSSVLSMSRLLYFLASSSLFATSGHAYLLQGTVYLLVNEHT